jgi:hypothetical protein
MASVLCRQPKHTHTQQQQQQQGVCAQQHMSDSDEPDAASAGDEQLVLLGVPGGSDAAGAKLGGSPSFAGLVRVNPECSRCRQAMPLACQIPAAYGDFAARYLYVFSCGSAGCEAQWAFLRGQTKAASSFERAHVSKARAAPLQSKDVRPAGMVSAAVASPPVLALEMAAPSLEPDRCWGLGEWTVDAVTDDLDALMLAKKQAKDAQVVGGRKASSSPGKAAATTSAVLAAAAPKPAKQRHLLLKVVSEPASSLEHEADLLAKYNAFAAGLGEETFAPGAEMDAEDEEFALRLSREPGQMIRYAWGGRPLLPDPSMRPTQVPCCAKCGSARLFEAQLTPASLGHIQALTGNKSEWSTVLFYSCAESCDAQQTEWGWVCDLI